MPGILNKLDDYFRAVSAARDVHNVSAISAINSVVAAKLVYGMGPRLHSLFGLSGVPRSDWKNFQKDADLEAVLAQLNPKSKRNISKDKIKFNQHCEKHGIPHIRTVYSDSQEPLLSDQASRERFIQSIESGPDSLFFKFIDGAHGYGAFSAKRVDGTWHYAGQSGSVEDLYEFCQSNKGHNIGWLVQPELKTHSDLRAIASMEALSTARIVTCMTPAGPEVMFALFKLARGDNPHDNFTLGSTGNMVAEIDIDTGTLGPAKGSLNSDYPSIMSFAIDPETGHKIAGRKMPFWAEAKQILLHAQGTLPDLKTLGWDLAITDDGPVVVETNTNYGGELVEIAYGRGLKPSFLEKLKTLV